MATLGSARLGFWDLAPALVRGSSSIDIEFEAAPVLRNLDPGISSLTNSFNSLCRNLELWAALNAMFDGQELRDDKEASMVSKHPACPALVSLSHDSA